jgi:hydroxypyruvate reductase
MRRVLDAALAAVEPGRAVRGAVRVEAGVLRVGKAAYRLGGLRRVLVVGCGKASAPMAAAVESLLEGQGPRVEGVVAVRYGHHVPTRRVRIAESGHPIPDEASVEAATAIAELVSSADERDLVLCLVSGGGSAVLTLPEEGITLADMQHFTEVLLRSGATINEFNVLRKHLDRLKGGGLAQLAAPAPVLTLALSDVVGNPLDAIGSGPTVPDPTTWRDAGDVLDRYVLWEELPASIVARIQAGLRGELEDTPGAAAPIFSRTRAMVVGSGLVACEAAAAEARRLGLEALILSTYVEGEAREVAHVLGGIVREVAASGHPLARPCCMVAGGETTVTVRGSGRGGRNQELALAAAWPLAELSNVLLVSIGTDGSDGPTDAAGAWVDGSTLARARELGLDPARALAENDAYPLLDAVGGLVRTGPTNTNVNDLMLLFAFGES